MALVKYQEAQVKDRESIDWLEPRNAQKTTETGEKSSGAAGKPVRYPVNYEKIEELLSIGGLKTAKDEASTPEAHTLFMQKVKEIFIKPGRAQLPPVALQQRHPYASTSLKPTGPSAARSNSTAEEDVDNESQHEPSHDIRDYTKNLRKQRKDEVDMAVKTDGAKILRKLLRKLPFQRTGEDINVMYKALKTFTSFSSMMSNRVLRELCYVAQLDNWKEEDFPVFGSSGMHMILKGSVVTIHSPHIFRPKTSLQDFKRECTNFKHSLTGEKPPQKILGVGECFGTFEAIDGQAMHKTMLMVHTNDPHCEFLKVTTSDYQKVIEQMRNKEQTKKLNLLQACEHFKMWTRQPKIRVANLIEWQNFTPNTVIVSEGYKAPFIGFILSGECHVLKQLEVLGNLPNGEQERRVRQVVMGSIGPNESFAELSLLKEEPMTYSIITSTEVTLGTISPDNLYSLDETTLELLLQSCQPTFDNLTQEMIQHEYMDQELKREWNQYRHNAVIEAINAQGVRPGYGKWKKS